MSRIGWRLRSAALDLDLELDAVLDAQELDTTVRYWEGAIDARGRRAGRLVSAEGYLELTGYGEQGAADRPGAPRGRGAGGPA